MIVCSYYNFDYYRPSFESYVKKLERASTLENTMVYSFYPHISFLVHNAVLTCTAGMSSEASCTEQFKSAPNKS